jgi:predicted SnoaL-like aldol condensation-catalyzing enzyme
MLIVAENLRETIRAALPLLGEIRDAEASRPIAEGKWSRKEILGHLLDSACNNQQKFVRTMEDAKLNFVGYHQTFWVESQKYNAADWSALIAFWREFNLHLAHIIENTDPALLANTITIDDYGTFTLEFIMKDYVEHLKHHLLQILPTGPFSSKFANVYNA